VGKYEGGAFLMERMGQYGTCVGVRRVGKLSIIENDPMLQIAVVGLSEREIGIKNSAGRV
jgi:hypothetical protein